MMRGGTIKGSKSVPMTNPFEVLYQKNFDIFEGRTIYLSRHGESEYNVEDRIGGNSSITERGHQYARALGTYMNTTGISDLTVWTSTLVRTQQTAQFVNAPKTVFQELNEINAGKFEDFTFTEVMQSHPQEYAARQKDKLCYRYPQGESYMDCCQRILPVMEQLEQCDEATVLLVAHQAILRCIVTYLLKGDLRKLPNVKIPQHCLIRVTYLNGENIIDYIRTPIDHSEQGIIKSILDEVEDDTTNKDNPVIIKSAV